MIATILVWGIGILFVCAGCSWIYRIFWGKCDYCGSSDLVPDDGLFFYCNKCRRKS